MSTFDYLTPSEAVAAAQDGAPAHMNIRGLLAADADWLTRTSSGQARKPENTWEARAYLGRFKKVARVEWAQDADPGTIEVHYADGTSAYLHHIDLLCVERPITGPTPTTEQPAEGGPYDGQNWATHSVLVWVENDSSFVDTARSYARFDETGEQLGQYIDRLLFDRSALAPKERNRITADNARTLKLVAGDLTQEGDDTPAREALKRVNWRYIAAQLTDES